MNKCYESFGGTESNDFMYLLYELVEMQKLLDDLNWSKEEEIDFQKQYYPIEDYVFRYMKLC